MPSLTVEQSTHQPRLEKALGRRSAVRAPTEMTRLKAPGQTGAVSPELPAAATDQHLLLARDLDLASHLERRPQCERRLVVLRLGAQ